MIFRSDGGVSACARAWFWLAFVCCVISFAGGYRAGFQAAPRFACACDQREAR